MVEFDFLGKDSIRYYNKVQVEKRVFKNLQLFSDNKAPADDLFDRLNVSINSIKEYFNCSVLSICSKRRCKTGSSHCGVC